MEEGATDGKSWIKTCASEGVDFAECPEDDADGDGDEDSHVRGACVLASNVKDEEYEQESTHHFHVERAKFFGQLDLIVIDIFLRNCRGDEEGH